MHVPQGWHCAAAMFRTFGIPLSYWKRWGTVLQVTRHPGTWGYWKMVTCVFGTYILHISHATNLYNTHGPPCFRIPGYLLRTSFVFEPFTALSFGLHIPSKTSRLSHISRTFLQSLHLQHHCFSGAI